MPMLFDTKEQAEKEAYKFGCEGAHQMGDKWMPCSMHKHNHQKGKFTLVGLIALVGAYITSGQIIPGII